MTNRGEYELVVTILILIDGFLQFNLGSLCQITRVESQSLF